MKTKPTPAAGGILLRRIALLVFLDILTVNLCAFLALYVRYEFDLAALTESGFLTVLGRCALPGTVLTLSVFALFRLYTSLWGFAGVEELARIFLSVALTACVQGVLIGLKVLLLPRSFPLLWGMLLFITTTILRFSYRFLRRLSAVRRHAPQQRTMLIGSGQAGAAVLREFRNSQFSRNQVVCIIDDDPVKHGRQLMGVRVIGGRELIEAAVDKYNISEIILAIPTLSIQAKKDIWEICSRTGCKFKQMPGIYQLANGEISIQKIRDIEIEDLLQRDVVKVDLGGPVGAYPGQDRHGHRRRRQHRQ